MASGEAIITPDVAFCEVCSEELRGLTPLFQQYFAEMQYPGRLSVDSLEKTWCPLMRQGRASVMVLKRCVPLALIAATFLPDMFNGELTAYLTMWYVSPELRGRGIGREMLQFMENRAQEKGCTSIMHGHMFSVNKDGGRQLLEPLGYAATEIGFRKHF